MSDKEEFNQVSLTERFKMLTYILLLEFTLISFGHHAVLSGVFVDLKLSNISWKYGHCERNLSQNELKKQSVGHFPLVFVEFTLQLSACPGHFVDIKLYKLRTNIDEYC